eukprot:9390089-Pyramimonas_sp.AAC.1
MHVLPRNSSPEAPQPECHAEVQPSKCYKGHRGRSTRHEAAPNPVLGNLWGTMCAGMAGGSTSPVGTQYVL